MCWFKDCEKMNKLQEELEFTKHMLIHAEKLTDELRKQWLQSRKEVADLIKPQWINVEHVMPNDGQRVNVVALIGPYRIMNRAIADYCKCKGWIHPFESFCPEFKDMHVLYWSPIPEMTEEIRRRE